LKQIGTYAKWLNARLAEKTWTSLFDATIAEAISVLIIGYQSFTNAQGFRDMRVLLAKG
jgi:hypothetical protein